MVVDWAELYRTAFPELVRFLHRKVWDIERAKDLAQETFVRALREEPAKPRGVAVHRGGQPRPGRGPHGYSP